MESQRVLKTQYTPPAYTNKIWALTGTSRSPSAESQQDPKMKIPVQAITRRKDITDAETRRDNGIMPMTYLACREEDEARAGTLGHGDPLCEEDKSPPWL